MSSSLRSSWPDLDRLARFVRASDSLTDTLAAWTGHPPAVGVLGRGDVCSDPRVAAALHLPDGARVQERVVLVRCADAVVAAGRSYVAADSPALTAVRDGLQGDAALGDLLRPLDPRRVVVATSTLRSRPAGDPTTPVLTVQTRFDVGGTPVAWCDETIFEAVFAESARPRRLRTAA